MKTDIKYEDVIALEFKVQVEFDEVYENKYGFPYKIFTLKLRKGILIDWQQSDGQCMVYRHKNDCILAKYELFSLEELQKIIEIFKK